MSINLKSRMMSVRSNVSGEMGGLGRATLRKDAEGKIKSAIVC